MWNLKKLNSQKQSRLVVPRDKEVRGGSNVQHGDYTQQHAIVYLKVVKEVDLKVLIVKKKKGNYVR